MLLIAENIDREKFVLDRLKSNSACQPDRELFFSYN